MTVTVVFPRYVFAWSSGRDLNHGLAPTFYLPGFARFAGLADPTKWIGAWAYNDGAGANLISPSSGSATLGGAASSLLRSADLLAPLTSGVGAYGGAGYFSDHTGATTTQSRERGFDMGAVFTPSALSVAYFSRRAVAGSPGVDIHTTKDFLTLTGLYSPADNAVYNNAGTRFNFPLQVEVADANWHHYAISWSEADNVFRAYVDGVLKTQIAVSGEFAFRYLGPNNSVSSARRGAVDNLCVAATVLSPAAIASLAAGNMPNSSGVLT